MPTPPPAAQVVGTLMRSTLGGPENVRIRREISTRVLKNPIASDWSTDALGAKMRLRCCGICGVSLWGLLSLRR
jgi:hypothetical protein